MQKDTYYSQQIAERVKALALGLFGRRAARIERETRLVANLCYYGTLACSMCFVCVRL